MGENGDRSGEVKKGATWPLYVLFGPVALCLLGLAFVMFAGDSDDGAGDGYYAEVACQEYVMERLKAPSTADFDTEFEEFNGSYSVTGTVDSENSFGAMLRNDFTCVVSRSGPDGWRMDSLVGLG